MPPFAMVYRRRCCMLESRRQICTASPAIRHYRFQHRGNGQPLESGCRMSWLRFVHRVPHAEVLVVDAAVAITVSLSEIGWKSLGREELVAPHLMWSEASSVMHELRWRKEISGELAAIALDRLAEADVSPRRPKGLIEEAWRIADRLGWT